MSKVRINDLARELEVKSRPILDALEAIGVTGKTHSSSIEADQAERVREYFKNGGKSSTASRQPADTKPKFDLSKVSKPGDALKAILERKQAEAELLKTLSREKELGLLRSKFVSMVSHEFRTPLGIIQSSAEILDDYLDRLEPVERKEHLKSIRKNTRRMAALMEEVLLIGSFDAGKMDFKSAPIDLARFAGRLVDEVLSATDRRCPILLTLDEMPSSAHADERLLRHIFTNLLTNAVKYSECGKAVQFEITTDDADAVCLIRDRGIGIPDEDREWLFSAFHRGQNVGERPGTGLGLVIVKRCNDAHGGRIQVDSTLGAGTTVTVRLPVFTNMPLETRNLATATHPITSL